MERGGLVPASFFDSDGAAAKSCSTIFVDLLFTISINRPFTNISNQHAKTPVIAWAFLTRISD